MPNLTQTSTDSTNLPARGALPHTLWNHLGSDIAAIMAAVNSVVPANGQVDATKLVNQIDATKLINAVPLASLASLQNAMFAGNISVPIPADQMFSYFGCAGGATTTATLPPLASTTEGALYVLLCYAVDNNANSNVLVSATSGDTIIEAQSGVTGEPSVSIVKGNDTSRGVLAIFVQWGTSWLCFRFSCW